MKKILALGILSLFPVHGRFDELVLPG